MQEEINGYTDGQEEEIDLIELALKLWDKRRLLIKSGLIAAVIGLVVAFSIPKEYEASVVLVPESGSAGGTGSMGALAALAGFNIGGGAGSTGDAVYPELYPDVVSSEPFSLALSEVKLPTKIDDNDVMTLKELLTDHTSKPWWSVIIGFPFRVLGMLSSSDDSETGANRRISFEWNNIDSLSQLYQPNSLHLTKKECELVEQIKSCVAVSVDNKTQLINISVTLQDPVAAACLADTVANRLTYFVTAYRTNKARHDLAFARQINKEAQERYYQAQQNYAKAIDRNQGIILKSASIDLDRLQNEASLAYDLYNSTSQQVQMAEVKVQENTPVFTVVKPAIVPFKAAKPRKLLILIGFVFLGVVGASAYVLFGSSFVNSFKEKSRDLKQKA